MKQETRLLIFPPRGIAMLLLSYAAVGANAATISQTPGFSFTHRTTLTHQSMGASVPKFIPWSMACMAVCGAMFIRRRSH